MAFLPEFNGRNFAECFQYLLDRLDKRIKSWSSRLLNQAGKEIMIKFVLQALPTYAMQCFLIPQKLINKIEQRIRVFWWHTKDANKPIPWVKWTSLTAPKRTGGIGFRNLRCFNKALLAKQVWRMHTQPTLLVAKVFKAKYFRKEKILSPPERKSTSFGWRSIQASIPLIKQHISKQIGPGKNTHIWQERWLQTKPPRAPKAKRSIDMQQLSTPSQLMGNDTRTWDPIKVRECVIADDVQDVLNTRILQYARSDKVVWPYTKNGQYTVKTGYNILYEQQAQAYIPSTSMPLLLHTLCRKTWNLSLPPKIKIFWWKVLQNGLPTMTNLRIRGVDIDPTCKFCHEWGETTDHLFIHCKLSKEVWYLLIPEAFNTRHLSTMDFINYLWTPEKKGSSPLSAFVGWNIWKMRNSVVFNKESIVIPQVMHKASCDHQAWSTTGRSPDRNKAQQRSSTGEDNQPFEEKIENRCYVDASWTSTSSNIGISWRIYKQINFFLHGLGSFPPTPTTSDAEAWAISEACNQISRFGVPGTTILSDAKVVIDCINDSIKTRGRSLAEESNDTQYVVATNPYIEDICRKALAIAPMLQFRYIPRLRNSEADAEARRARQEQLAYKITWP